MGDIMENKIIRAQLKANKFLENRYYYKGESKLNFFSSSVENYKDMFTLYLVLLALYQRKYGNTLNRSEFLDFCNEIQKTEKAQIIVVVARFKQFKIINSQNDEIMNLSFLFDDDGDSRGMGERQFIAPQPKIEEKPKNPAPTQKPIVKKIINPRKKDDDLER